MKLPRRRFLQAPWRRQRSRRIVANCLGADLSSRPARIIVATRRWRSGYFARLVGQGCRSGSATHSSSRTGPGAGTNNRTETVVRAARDG